MYYSFLLVFHKQKKKKAALLLVNKGLSLIMVQLLPKKTGLKEKGTL